MGAGDGRKAVAENKSVEEVICYMEYIPNVIQVMPLKNYRALVFFDDGKIVIYDLNHLLALDVFKPLKDMFLFSKTMTVLNGTLAFDLKGKYDPAECIDIDPVVIYKEGVDVTEELSWRDDLLAIDYDQLHQRKKGTPGVKYKTGEVCRQVEFMEKNAELADGTDGIRTRTLCAVARAALQKGFSIDDIVEITGLTRETVNRIQNDRKGF
nr:DUF2442 domain-containing protein [Desulfofundulus thermobenzoicus]